MAPRDCSPAAAPDTEIAKAIGAMKQTLKRAIRLNMVSPNFVTDDVTANDDVRPRGGKAQEIVGTARDSLDELRLRLRCVPCAATAASANDCGQ
jgi:hypothetical protein